MNGAAKFDFSFNVDNVAGPDSGRRGNPDRVTESVFTKIDNGKPVNLANAASRRIDKNRLSLDRVNNPFFNPAKPMIASLDGPNNIVGRHAGSVALSGPVVRLR
jgi:hypothetical protein